MKSIMCEGVIVLWEVLFDNDPESYTYLSVDKAIQAVRTFADIHIDDHPQKKDIIEKIMSGIEPRVTNKSAEGRAMVMIGDANVTIRRITIDSLNPIHKVLIRAHSQVDDDTREAIASLFTVLT